MKFVKIEGSRKLSSFIKPMMATLTEQPAFDDPDWLFEVKWDGYRAIAETGGKDLKLYSRNGLTFDLAYPKVFSELKAIKHKAVLDGEIVVFDQSGLPSFQKLQNYRSQQHYIIQYYVFDCLAYEGKSIARLPLVERKAILQELLPASDIIRYCDHVEEQGKALFKEMVKMNIEGMIAKRKDSKYAEGKRSTDWLKIKNVKTQEAIIIGFTDPKGSRSYFGSLLLAVNKRGKLVSIGGVGTGFTDKSLKEIHAKLKKHVRKTSPLDVPIKEADDITWVDPVLVCNIRFTEITEEGSIRHPVFQGLRIDKSPAEVKPEY
jgi:bifunctional non-homologous end joining protein LigD